MIRYSNRFKAGTRRNKKWARSNGPDRHCSINSDYKEAVYNAVGIVEFHPDGTPKTALDVNFKSKPNHAARALNVDWKAEREARLARIDEMTKAMNTENERRLKEDFDDDTSTMEGAKEYMDKVLGRKAVAGVIQRGGDAAMFGTSTIEPGHI